MLGFVMCFMIVILVSIIAFFNYYLNKFIIIIKPLFANIFIFEYYPSDDDLLKGNNPKYFLISEFSIKKAANEANRLFTNKYPVYKGNMDIPCFLKEKTNWFKRILKKTKDYGT